MRVLRSIWVRARSLTSPNTAWKRSATLLASFFMVRVPLLMV
jgi:hypothetical protein